MNVPAGCVTGETALTFVYTRTSHNKKVTGGLCGSEGTSSMRTENGKGEGEGLDRLGQLYDIFRII